MSDINKIKATLSSLLHKTTENGATEAEAMAAMDLANKLSEKYAISLEELTKVNAKLDFDQRHTENPTHRIQPIDRGLAMALQEYTGTKCWVSQHEGTTTFLGLPADVELALFLRELHRNTMNAECNIYINYIWDKQGGVSVARASFQYGYCARVAERLREYRRQSGPTGTALVVKKRELVEAEATRRGISLKRGRTGGQTRMNMDAYGYGQHSGSQASMGRATSNNKTAQIASK
jgi:hypothetical protein